MDVIVLPLRAIFRDNQRLPTVRSLLWGYKRFVGQNSSRPEKTNRRYEPGTDGKQDGVAVFLPLRVLASRMTSLIEKDPNKRIRGGFVIP